jgi:hypothetical protein
VVLTFDSEGETLSPHTFREIGTLGANRPVRLAPSRERWDVTLHAGVRVPLRFRVTMLVVPGRVARLHVKGLTCFVRSPGSQHASAALSVDGDGAAEFLSTTRERLAHCRWGWGRGDHAGGGVTFAIPDEPPVTLAWDGPRTALALAFDGCPDVVVLRAP